VVRRPSRAISDRHLTTTNQPLARGLGDPTIADAILDRLLERSHRIELAGNSRRRNDATPRAKKSMTPAANDSLYDDSRGGELGNGTHQHSITTSVQLRRNNCATSSEYAAYFVFGLDRVQRHTVYASNAFGPYERNAMVDETNDDSPKQLLNTLICPNGHTGGWGYWDVIPRSRQVGSRKTVRCSWGTITPTSPFMA